MTTNQIVLAVLAAVLVFWCVGAYNRLVGLRNSLANAFAQIDVQLKRRYDLIPNLVEVARKYMDFERTTLEAVTAARNQAQAAADKARPRPGATGELASLALAEQVLGGALGRLMAVVENYPELKADQQMRELSEELTSTENKVTFSRQLYNDAVYEFNTASQEFPTRLIAGIFGFREAGPLQATQTDAERAAVRVQF